MSLLYLILLLVIAGVLLYFFNTYVTRIDPRIKTIINVVVIICVVLWVLYAFGILSGLSSIRVPSVN